MAFGRFAAAHYGVVTSIDQQTEPGLEDFLARQRARCLMLAHRSYRSYVRRTVALHREPWPTADLHVTRRGYTEGGAPSETEDE